MRYIIRHNNGTLRFQIRVPAALIPRFGRMVRQNLATADLSEARALALQLAGDWLRWFSAARYGIELPQVAQTQVAQTSMEADRRNHGRRLLWACASLRTYETDA